MNEHEFNNECFLILLLYSLFIFTSYLDIMNQRLFAYNVGFIIIGLIALCMVWNMAIIMRKVLGILKWKIPALYYSSKIYKRRKYKEQERKRKVYENHLRILNLTPSEHSYDLSEHEDGQFPKTNFLLRDKLIEEQQRTQEF